jgi:hypothetical protein
MGQLARIPTRKGQAPVVSPVEGQGTGADLSYQSAPTQHLREPQKQPQLEALPSGQQQM